MAAGLQSADKTGPANDRITLHKAQNADGQNKQPISHSHRLASVHLARTVGQPTLVDGAFITFHSVNRCNGAGNAIRFAREVAIQVTGTAPPVTIDVFGLGGWVVPE